MLGRSDGADLHSPMWVCCCGRYPLPSGQIEVTAVRGVDRSELTTQLARRSGFDSIEDLLVVAQHGSGRLVFVVDF
jgi:hypothetical protein